MFARSPPAASGATLAIMSEIPRALTRADLFALSAAVRLGCGQTIDLAPLPDFLPHTHPATLEGSVLPALRVAVDQHRPLRGCRLASHGVNAQTGALVVEIGAGLPWAVEGQIDRGSMDDVLAGCRGLVAVALAAFRHDRLKPTECPVCLALGGWLPQCGACERAALLAGAPPETTTSRYEEGRQQAKQDAAALSIPLKDGRTLVAETRTREDGRREVASVTTTDGSGLNTHGKHWPPEHEAARRHAARLLGHEAPPIRPETMGPDDPRRAASGPPEGYRFRRVTNTEIAVACEWSPNVVWAHVHAGQAEPYTGTWLSAAEHRAAFEWARGPLA